MFNLDQAITEWRRQMSAGGLVNPKVLDELEGHLREDVEQQMRLGSDAQHAFARAVRRIGEARALKAEFANTPVGMETRFAQLMGIACVIIAGFFSLLILPKLFHHAMGWPAKILGLAAVATAVASWRYGHGVLPAIRNHRIRSAIGTACCLVGMVWIGLFITFIIPRFFDVPVEQVQSGRLMASFIWAWTAVAALGGVAYGLEKAVRRHISMADS